MQTINPPITTDHAGRAFLARRMAIMKQARTRWHFLKYSMPPMGVSEERHCWHEFLVRNGLANGEGREN